MRCYICDWSPKGGQSAYNEGLSFEGAEHRRLLTDTKGRTVCSHCEAESYIPEDDRAIEHEELEELDE